MWIIDWPLASLRVCVFVCVREREGCVCWKAQWCFLFLHFYSIDAERGTGRRGTMEQTDGHTRACSHPISFIHAHMKVCIEHIKQSRSRWGRLGRFKPTLYMLSSQARWTRHYLGLPNKSGFSFYIFWMFGFSISLVHLHNVWTCTSGNRCYY